MGFGEAGFGETGFGETEFGEAGFGVTGFGEAGFGEVGFGEAEWNRTKQPVACLRVSDCCVCTQCLITAETAHCNVRGSLTSHVVNNCNVIPLRPFFCLLA